MSARFRRCLKLRTCFIQRGFRLFFLSLSLFSPTLCLSGAESSVYFWHRERNDATYRFLASFGDWRIYALRGEFRNNVPPVLLRAVSAPQSVPVFRLDARIWRTADFTRRFASILRRETSPEIQIDCDVPESLLHGYALFLENLRAQIPEKHFSVTLLPCHLRHPAELRRISRQISYFVLQLHALERPEDLPSEYRLFDFSAAVRAMDMALGLQMPFKMALPAYAYRLHYSEKTGKFRRLSAENTPRKQKDEIVKIALPDWGELLEFRKKYAEIPVIWFRLAVPGDRLCLEAENLRRLDAGISPLETMEISVRRSGELTGFYWTNHGILGERMHTQFLGGGVGEAFFFHGVRPVRPAVPGCVPERIRGPVPPPGTTIKTGEIHRWIQTDSKKSR